ncbi:MAG: mandelate racemase/muconate lactonizing enzyme family protein [Candidatus Poribacteria bacterium]|nr:mandelate racemase/muconate lactonizing enzyme family protein [Candidatus Poribacteria bacterium]
MLTDSFKITAIESQLYEWDKPPIWNGMHVYDKGRLHLVKVTAKSGTEAHVGYGFNGGTAATRPLSIFPKFVDLFRPALIGHDVTDTAYVSRLAENYKIYGPGGYHTQVLAAINQACWDVHGKIEGKSVHALLGGTQQRICTYIAGGYYGREKGFDELREEMSRNINAFNATAVKMKIGDPDAGIKTDIKRIEVVRETVGSGITVMVDANCALSIEEARAFLPALQANKIFWFEEPIHSHDYRGHKALRATAQDYGIRIATGENGYGLHYFQTLIDYDGADVFNLDVAILPGYDPAMQVVEEASGAEKLIAPHGAQELQIHIAASRDNGLMLEYYPPVVDPLRGEMFLPQMVLDADGYVTVPPRPGIGFEPNWELLKHHRV